MTTIIEHDVLGSVRALAGLIREHAEQAERERRLSPSVVEGMTAAGLFRMLVPRPLGGLEVEPLTCARAIEEIARCDSAAGWALVNSNSLAWWCFFFNY